MKTTGKSAWIVEWRPHSHENGMSNLRPFILPRTWGTDRVLDFMRVIYWNSDLHCLFETQAEVHKTKSQKILISNSGRRIDYSEYGGTILIAAKVDDLRISWTEDSEVMEWTVPPHLAYDRENGKISASSRPFERRYVSKASND